MSLRLLIAALVGIIGWASASEPALRVVATTGMIADVVREVGGERVAVTGLIGTGVDPHLYQPTRTDRKLLQDAQAIFYNGLLLEGRMQDLFIQLAATRPVHAVTQLIPSEFLLEAEAGHPDPHVWNDPLAWRQGVAVVAAKLAEIDAAGAAHYQQRAGTYAARLTAFDAWARTAVASVPEPQRVLITAHDAFNYFGRAYGFEVLGIQGVSTEAQASLEDINRLVGMLVERKIPAIFVESSVPEKNVRALIEGAAARGHAVTVGGEIFSDAMGAEGSWEGTYLGMQDHNVCTIVKALGGQVADGGFRATEAP